MLNVIGQVVQGWVAIVRDDDSFMTSKGTVARIHLCRARETFSVPLSRVTLVSGSAGRDDWNALDARVRAHQVAMGRASPSLSGLVSYINCVPVTHQDMRNSL